MTPLQVWETDFTVLMLLQMYTNQPLVENKKEQQRRGRLVVSIPGAQGNMKTTLLLVKIRSRMPAVYATRPQPASQPEVSCQLKWIRCSRKKKICLLQRFAVKMISHHRPQFRLAAFGHVITDLRLASNRNRHDLTFPRITIFSLTYTRGLKVQVQSPNRNTLPCAYLHNYTHTALRHGTEHKPFTGTADHCLSV